MSTFRDAVRRLQIIYNDCNPQAKNNRETEKSMDEFTRLKKFIHQDVKAIHQVMILDDTERSYPGRCWRKEKNY